MKKRMINKIFAFATVLSMLAAFGGGFAPAVNAAENEGEIPDSYYNSFVSYSSKTGGTFYVKNLEEDADLSDNWYCDANGLLHRNASGGCAALYLREKVSGDNIRITVEYTSTHDKGEWGAYIGFGAPEQGGNWYTGTDQSTANIIRLHHTGQSGYAPAATGQGDDWLFMSGVYQNYLIDAKDYESVHTAVIELKYNTAYLWIDGIYRGGHELVNYENGYIFLGAYNSDVSFGIPKVEIIDMAPAGSTSSPAYGKTALFLGDSIADGAFDPAAWAERLGYHFNMTVKNNAAGGWILADDDRTGLGSIQEQLEREIGFDYDYIIIEGGINDVMQNTNVNSSLCVMGSISDSMDPSSFDTTTFAGALESLLYNATKYYGDTKVGFILTYKPTERWVADWSVAEQYMALAKQICQKWGVSCLDLWNNEELNALLHSDTDAYLPDGLHVNHNGYNVLDAYIVEWFEKLDAPQTPDEGTDPTEPADQPTQETTQVPGASSGEENKTPPAVSSTLVAVIILGAACAVAAVILILGTRKGKGSEGPAA